MLKLVLMLILLLLGACANDYSDADPRIWTGYLASPASCMGDVRCLIQTSRPVYVSPRGPIR